MKRMIVLGALVFTVSPGFAHRVRVDFDHGINFSGYKTYRWVIPPDAPSRQALFPNQLMQERIAGFIQSVASVDDRTCLRRTSHPNKSSGFAVCPL